MIYEKNCGTKCSTWIESPFYRIIFLTIGIIVAYPGKNFGVHKCFSGKIDRRMPNCLYCNWLRIFEPPEGQGVRIVVSLGTKFEIPKLKRSAVARIVKDRLSGRLPLFLYDAQLVSYADYIVKKIQTEGKWDSARQRVAEFKESDRQTAEIFVEDVQHGYSRELGPILIGDTFWNRLNFPAILRECGFRESEITTAEISILNRLISQDSENGIIPWLGRVAIDELLGIDFMQFGNDRFYRISDKLLKHHLYIERKAVSAGKTLVQS